MSHAYRVKKWENFIKDYERDVFDGISIGNDFVFNIIFYRCLRSIPMAYALRHAAPAFCRGYINMLFRYFLVDKNDDDDDDDNTLFNVRMDKKVSYYSIDFDSSSKELAFAKLFYEKACKGADKQNEMKKGGMTCDEWDDMDGVIKRGKVSARKHKLSAANHDSTPDPRDERNIAMLRDNSKEPRGMRNKQDFIAYVQCCVEILNHGDLRTGRYSAKNQFEDVDLKNNFENICKQWMLWSPNNSQQFSKCYWPESLGLYYTGCVIITARLAAQNEELYKEMEKNFNDFFLKTNGRHNWNIPAGGHVDARIRDWLKLRPISVFLNEIEIVKKENLIQIHIDSELSKALVTVNDEDGQNPQTVLKKLRPSERIRELWCNPNGTRDDDVMLQNGEEPIPETLLIQLDLNHLVKETTTKGGYIESLGNLLPKLLISTGNRDKCMPALKNMQTQWTYFEFGRDYVDKCWKDSGRNQIIKNAITNVRRIVRRKAIQAAALYMDRNKSGNTVSGDKSYYKTPQSGENRPFSGKYRMEGFDADTWLDGYKTNPEKSRAIDKTTKGGTPGREKMTRPRHQPQRLGDYDKWWDSEEKQSVAEYGKYTQIGETQRRLDREDNDVNLWQTIERIRHLVSGGDGLPAWHNKMFRKGTNYNYKEDENMPGGYRKGNDNWVGRSSRTGNFNTEAAHTAIPIKQVVNMVMNDILTASGPIMYNDGDQEYYDYTPEEISGPYTVEPNETIIVDRLNPTSEHRERGKFSQVEYPLNNFKLSRNDNDGGAEEEIVWTWEHLRTVEDGALWKKIMMGLFEEGVYQWNASRDVFMGLATAHWWVDDADAALETAKNLGWQRDIVQHGIRKLERPTFIRGMEKPTKDEMVVFWSNMIFFILNSNNERPYVQYWLPKPIASPAMVWSGATINANIPHWVDKDWLTTILVILKNEIFRNESLPPRRSNNMPSFGCVVKLLKSVIYKLIKMLYPGGTGCNIRFVENTEGVDNAEIITRGSGYEEGDILVVRFKMPTIYDTPTVHERMYRIKEVDENGGVRKLDYIETDKGNVIILSIVDAIGNDEGFDTYTLTKNRGNFYKESHYNEVFGEDALKTRTTFEQLHWVDNNPYYPNPTGIMVRVCQMIRPYLCQKTIQVPGSPNAEIIYCRKKDNSEPVPYGKIAIGESTKTDYRHVRYATTSIKSYESQQRDNNSWFNYAAGGRNVEPWLFKDDMITREVFEEMAGDLVEEDADFEWIKEWWGRMQGKTTGPMFKRGGHLKNAGDVFEQADFGHIEVQLPTQWGETSEIDTIGGYFFPFYENHKLNEAEEDSPVKVERYNMPENVLLEGIFESGIPNSTESQKIVKYPVSFENGDHDQRISLNMAELRNILTKTVHDESVPQVVSGLIDNILIPEDTPGGSYLENIWEIREAYTIWKVQHYMFLHEFVSDVEAINSGRGAWDAFRSQDKATTQRWHRGKPRKLEFNNDTNGDNYNRDIYEETRIPQIQHYLGVKDENGEMKVTPWCHRGYENTAIALTQVHSSMGTKPSYKFRNMTIGFYEAVQDIATLSNQDEVYLSYEDFAKKEKKIRLRQPAVDREMGNWTKGHEAPAKGYLITGNRTHIRIRGVRLDRKGAYSSVKGWITTHRWYSEPEGNGFSQPTKTLCQPRVIMQIVSKDMYIGPERPDHKKSGLIFYMNDRHSEMLIGGFYPFKSWRYSQQLQRLDVDRDDNLIHNPCINNYTALAKIIRARDEWYVDAVEKNLLNIQT